MGDDAAAFGGVISRFKDQGDMDRMIGGMYSGIVQVSCFNTGVRADTVLWTDLLEKASSSLALSTSSWEAYQLIVDTVLQALHKLVEETTRRKGSDGVLDARPDRLPSNRCL